jgi:hypothetical protein
LVREFSLKLGLRLFDTYLSLEDGFISFHTYLCAGILLKYGKKLLSLDFG